MAVIITNRDMPKKCASCWHHFDCEYYNQTVEGYKHSNCPLKSIDGLAYAIEQFPFTYGFASDIQREINKYCDKENKDGTTNSN